MSPQRVRAKQGDRAPEPAIELRGSPRRLTAFLPAAGSGTPSGATPAVSVLIEGAVPERVRVRSRRAPDATPELRVRLAASTPPGRYEGAATVGDRTVPLVIDVEPASRVRAVPSRLEAVGDPAGSATFEVDLANSGNLPVDIPERSSFCLFDASGIDHAVWAALTTDPPKGKGRADVLLDDLAASHGGLVDVRVRDGAGPLAPGEGRTCRLEMRWSDRLHPGRRYAGAWEVAGLRLPIRVESPRARPSPAKSPAPAKPPTTARRAR